MKKSAIKAKKNTTIDDLAVMVASGFSRVDERFEQVDQRFEQVDMRFDQIDKRFDKVEKYIFNLDSKVQTIDTRLKNVEKALEPLTLSYNVFSREIRDMNLRISNLEKKIGIKSK